MGRADFYYSGVQRMVSNGDVILVQQSVRSQEPHRPVLPALQTVSAPEPEPEPAAAPGPQPAPEVVQTAETWVHTPPPPGYGFEFETGRLVPIHPNLAPFAFA